MMFTDDTLRPIDENEQYIASDGTQYPANFPKTEIPGVYPVTMTDKIVPSGKVVTGFHIDSSHTQVWDMRDKTPEELSADADEQARLSFGGYLTRAEALKSIRQESVAGGIEINGIFIETDAETRNSLIGVRIKAAESGDYTVKWKTGGGFIALDAATIIYIADTVAAHVQNCFAAEAVVLESVSNYSDMAQLQAAFDAAYAALPQENIGLAFRVVFDAGGGISSESVS